MSEEFQNVEPFPDAIEVIPALNEHYDLHIITGRPDSLSAATKKMLAQHLPDVFKTVQFTNFFGQKPRSKAEVCKQLNVDLLIDDHLHHAQVVAACGVRALLFGDYPWNESDNLQEGIERVKSWQDISDLLLPARIIK